MTSTRLLGFLLPALCLPFVVLRATAQPSVVLERNEPASPRALFHWAPEVGGQAPGLAAGLTYSYASNPLRLDAAVQGGRMAQQQLIHIGTAWQFERWPAELNVNWPVVVSYDGDTNMPVSGEPRLGVTLPIARAASCLPGAAVSSALWLPLGSKSALAGGAGPRYRIGAAVGGDCAKWLYRATLAQQSVRYAPESWVGSEVSAIVAAGYRLGSGGLGPELVVRRRSSSLPAGVTARWAVEALLTAFWQEGPTGLRVSAGRGFTDAPGTPDWRGLVSLNWVAERRAAAPASVDEENEPGAALEGMTPRARTLQEAVTKPRRPKKGALADRDGDGVADAADACPEVPGPAAGCPNDGDGDGVADAVDACPGAFGTGSAPGNLGCPLDADADGVMDHEDDCPAEAGTRSLESGRNGCAQEVRVVGGQIAIDKEIHFELGNAIIDAASEPTLRAVAAALQGRPEIVRVAIEGHTDNVGREADNLALSRARALAVARWLTEHGVDARRLQVRGFGPRRPRASNDTESGRAENRRVEFTIVQRDSRGRGAWHEGPVVPGQSESVSSDAPTPSTANPAAAGDAP